MRQSRLAVSTISLVLWTVVAAVGQQQPRVVQSESELLAKGLALRDFDGRHALLAPVDDSRKRLARDLQRRLGTGTEIRFNSRTGGVHHLFRATGRLTQPAAGDASTIIRQFLSTNSAVFGLSGSDISSFDLQTEDRDRNTGVTHLHLEQKIGGIRVFQSAIKAHVDGAGSIISIESNYFPGLQRPNLVPRLSAAEAVLTAIQSNLLDLAAKLAPHPAPAALANPASGNSVVQVSPPPAFPHVQQSDSADERLTVFDPGPFQGPIRAHLTIFPWPGGRASLAWEIHLHAGDRQAYYTILIDADSGALLYRWNSYRFAVNSNASIFPKNPDATPLTTMPFFGDPVASPNGWSSGAATIGNNVIGTSATSNGDFLFPFADSWKLSGANTFDLAGQRVRFTPTDPGATEYTVSVAAAAAIAPFALNLVPFLSPNVDDGTTGELICSGGGFSANVLGGTFSSFYVNSNGSISFSGGSQDFSPTKVNFSLDWRRIAGFWMDLTLAGGTLTGDCVVEGGGKTLRVAWIGVPAFGLGGSHTFSIVVHGAGTGLDNVIDISYGAVTVTSGMLVGVGGNSTAAFVGSTPGAVNYVDLSASPSPGIAGGVAQTFPDRDLNLSITNFSYHLNRMHDHFYQLGFTEAAGNYQLLNFNRGGAPGDPVLAEAQFGLGTLNNAFFSPAPDGLTGFTGFGLFSLGGACRRDSGFDAGVIIHEFTHGVSTRMIAGPLSVFTLGSFQGGALGEGWSDAFSTLYLNDPVTGAYTVCNPVSGIRSVAYNASPLNYTHLGNKNGPIVVSFGGPPVPPGIGSVFIPEVHQDGEIWATVMWDIGTAVGNDITQRLMFEGFRYTPIEPSFVDARNGILLADLVLYGGTHLGALNSVFAARGLGVSASSSSSPFADTGNGWDIVPSAAFDTAANPYGTADLVLFLDDFEQGPRGWTTEGVDGAGGAPLWHLSSRRASSGSNAYYYGKEATGNYDTGFRNYGSLISPPIKLPAMLGNSAIMLEWDQLKSTQNFVVDGGWVRIIEVGPDTRTQVAFVELTPASFGPPAFEHLRVNLNAFANKTIRVEFFIDTFNNASNTTEGWYVDNVKIAVLGVPNNAGFESGAAAPWTMYGPISGSVTTTQAHTGSFSISATAGAGGGFFQDAGSLVAGQTYRVSAWVKASPGATATGLLLVHDTTGANAAGGPTGMPGTNWQLIQVNFVATATGKVRIHLHRSGGVGTLFWDDIGVSLGSPAAINPGFEAGVAPWGVYGGVAAVASGAFANSGSFSLAESGGAGGVYQDIPGLTPGQIYQIIARFRSAPGTAGLAQLWVHDSTGANVVSDGPRAASISFFEQFAVNFVATTTGAVRIHLHYTGGAGTIYWDDVQMVVGESTPLLLNGGFEGGTSAWLPYGTVGVQAVSGTKVHTGGSSFQQSGAIGGGGIFQDVGGLIPGRIYRVGMWIAGNPVGTGSAAMFVHDTTGANAAISTASPTSAWQFVEVPFTATTTAKVRVHLHLFPGTGAVVYDDVIIRE